MQPNCTATGAAATVGYASPVACTSVAAPGQTSAPRWAAVAAAATAGGRLAQLVEQDAGDLRAARERRDQRGARRGRPVEQDRRRACRSRPRARPVSCGSSAVVHSPLPAAGAGWNATTSGVIAPSAVSVAFGVSAPSSADPDLDVRQHRLHRGADLVERQCVVGRRRGGRRRREHERLQAGRLLGERRCVLGERRAARVVDRKRCGGQLDARCRDRPAGAAALRRRSDRARSRRAGHVTPIRARRRPSFCSVAPCDGSSSAAPTAKRRSGRLSSTPPSGVRRSRSRPRSRARSAAHRTTLGSRPSRRPSRARDRRPGRFGSGHASVCHPSPSASRLVGPAAVFTWTVAGFESQKRSAPSDAFAIRKAGG